MAKIEFDTTTVAETDRPKKEFALIPDIKAHVEIYKTAVKQMASVEGGQRVEVEFKIIEGDYERRRIYASYTTRHPTNPNAEQIGRQIFKRLCEAVGIHGALDDTEDLHGRTLFGHIGTKEETQIDGSTKKKNVINRFESDGSTGGAISAKAATVDAPDGAPVAKKTWGKANG